jgi:hypothetical protein
MVNASTSTTDHSHRVLICALSCCDFDGDRSGNGAHAQDVASGIVTGA